VPHIGRQSCLVVGEIGVESDFAVNHTAYLYTARVVESRLIQPRVCSYAEIQDGIDMQVEVGLVYMKEVRLLLVEGVEPRLSAVISLGPGPFPVVVSEVRVIEFVGPRLEHAQGRSRIQELDNIRTLIRLCRRKEF